MKTLHIVLDELNAEVPEAAYSLAAMPSTRLVAELLYSEFGKESTRKGLVFKSEMYSKFSWYAELWVLMGNSKWVRAKELGEFDHYQAAASALDMENEGMFVRAVKPE